MHECICHIDPPPQAVGLGRNHAPFIQTEKCALFSLKLAFDLYPMSLKKTRINNLVPLFTPIQAGHDIYSFVMQFFTSVEIYISNPRRRTDTN